jgi:hypothetical protein
MYTVNSIHSTHMWCILFILLWPLMGPFLLQGYHWEKQPTGENRSTGRKTCPTATLSTPSSTGTNPELNSSLRVRKPGTGL